MNTEKVVQAAQDSWKVKGNLAVVKFDALELGGKERAALLLAMDIANGTKDVTVYYESSFVIRRAESLIRDINDGQNRSYIRVASREFGKLCETQVNKAIKNGRKAESDDTDSINFAIGKFADKMAVSEGMSYAESVVEYAKRQGESAAKKAKRAAKVNALIPATPAEIV